jgi:hypothetical protein
MSKELKIKIEDWDYTCTDNCCYDYGVRISINGVEVEHPYSTKESPIPNDYIGIDVQTAIHAVLKHLGYEVEMTTDCVDLNEVNYNKEDE